MTPFDHIKAIFTNQNIDYYDNLTESEKKTFNIYLINMGISMNPNYISIVNEINKFWDQLKPREVYLFYSQLLPKGKQYNPWIKSKKSQDYEQWMIDLVAKYFEISKSEAVEYIRIFYNSESGKGELKQIISSFGKQEKI